MQKESATPGVAHLRVLSDAMEELTSARTADDVVRIAALHAQKACNADNLWVVMASGEQLHFSVDAATLPLTHSSRSKAVARICEWALEERQTAVVPDVHRDERTRSHTNGSAISRSLVVVPVGGRAPFAAIAFAWAHEHWPGATDVLVLESLARAIGLALNGRHGAVRAISRSATEPVREWLGSVIDAEGVFGTERRHWVAVAELQHRLRNLLGLVRSVVRRTADTAASPEEYSAHLEGRINALARTQTLVTRHSGTGIDLEELVDAELLSRGAGPGQVESAGPPVRLRPKAAETLALALHELATNSAKFGALAGPDGRIIVTWRNEADRDDPCTILEWVETGKILGPPPAAEHRCFSRELLERTVPYELRGTTRLFFEPNAVRCVIEIPLTPDNVVTDWRAAVK